MNRRLAEAVVAAFRTEEAERVRRAFLEFSRSDWMRTRMWLHTSGMALYLLDRVTKLGIEDAMPDELVHEFAINLAENRVRTADLFEEFARVNMELQRAGICYVTLKGFSLAPTAFADPALRYQLDFDFLVARRDMDLCERVVEACGYRRRGVFGETKEFHLGTPAKSSMRDLYRVRSVKTIELHPVPEVEEARASQDGDRLSRLQLQTWNGCEFPALSEADKLLSQAMHLFQHFQGEWTRTSWLLEYANAVRAHGSGHTIWGEAIETIDEAPAMRTGAALASLVMCETFGVSVPRQFAAQTVDLLGPELRLWMARYGKDLVFTEHPGSKLYLLLRDVLERDHPKWRATRRSRLLPLHLPARVIVRNSNSLRMWWRAAAAQAKFTRQRLIFHFAQGVRYKLEAARWKRFIGEARL